MPLFPLYFEATEKDKKVEVELTDEQQKQREQDAEIIAALDEYQAPFRQRWLKNAAMYNLVQSGSSDVASNYYLGWARILINHSVAMMTEGEPEGDFIPQGPSDGKRAELWHALVKHALSKSNWQAHQRQWIIDNHIFGTGVLKSYAELPMRRKSFKRADGTIVDQRVRDFRRAKVGLRVRSPFRTLRSHFVSDPDDVPVGVEREVMTWNAFSVRYGDSGKYKTDQVPVGSHVRLLHVYDEEANRYRIYCVTWGNKPECVYNQEPSIKELGYPIYTVPLARYNHTEDGEELKGGLNVPGMTPLAFGIFEDQLDVGYETHSLYGMGLPEVIEGPEEIMQGLVNMTLDNLRLKNTVPISYEPLDPESPSYLDVDIGTMYSSFMIDGKISAQPLGVADVASNQAMWDWLKLVIYQLTGINPEQITGDNLKTAFQSGLVVRQMNMRAKARIRAWEQGPLKRAWTLLLANCLSELTVNDWEEITEEEAGVLAEKIKNDEMTGEDYSTEEVTNEDGTTTQVHKRKRMLYFPVQGRKFREDFKGKNKKRSLDYNSTQNTLIEDPSMPGDRSFVPADAKYLLPDGSIERILEYDVQVDGSHMLGDLKMQDMEMSQKAISNAMLVAKASPEVAMEIDWKKMLVSANKPAGFEEDDMFKTDTGKSKLAEVGKRIEEELAQAISQPSNVQPPAPMVPPQAGAPTVPSANAGQPSAPTDQPSGPAGLLAGVANGTV